MSKKYDLIVIGAGNGGLVSATYGAKNEFSTLLLEKHRTAGGFATSFTRGRFEFDVSLHEMCDLGTSFNPGTMYDMFKELGVDIEWIPTNEAFRLILNKTTRKSDNTLYLGEKNFLSTFDKIGPNEKEKVKKFLDLGEKYLQAFEYISETNGNPDSKVLKTKFKDFLCTAPLTLDQLEDKLKMTQETKDLVNGYWCYLGVPPKRIDAILYTMMTYLYITKNAYIPKNKSQEISMALLNRFYSFGGEARFNTEVVEIIVDNNKATGVKLANGEVIFADHIISNASKTLVYNYLVDKNKVEPKNLKMINARNHGIQGINIYIGLNKSAKELNLNNYSYFISNADSYEHAYESHKTLEGMCFQAATCVNAINEQASPEGTCILSITTFSIKNAWAKVTPRTYEATKNEIALRMITQFEQATGISIQPYIEEIEVGTPATFARYTNAFNGCIYGYEVEPWDSILMRLSNMFKEEGIQNLWFCGGWADRAHGFNSSYESGKLAFSLTLKDRYEGSKK